MFTEKISPFFNEHFVRHLHCSDESSSKWIQRIFKTFKHLLSFRSDPFAETFLKNLSAIQKLQNIVTQFNLLIGKSIRLYEEDVESLKKINIRILEEKNAIFLPFSKRKQMLSHLFSTILKTIHLQDTLKSKVSFNCDVKIRILTKYRKFDVEKPLITRNRFQTPFKSIFSRHKDDIRYSARFARDEILKKPTPTEPLSVVEIIRNRKRMLVIRQPLLSDLVSDYSSHKYRFKNIFSQVAMKYFLKTYFGKKYKMKYRLFEKFDAPYQKLHKEHSSFLMRSHQIFDSVAPEAISLKPWIDAAKKVFPKQEELDLFVLFLNTTTNTYN